ncbi:MAG: hypothetical protein ACLFVQ_11000 [Chitinispirillaceae bacterium]
MDNLIWYASYGSNLQKERFLCYIEGGRARGASFSHPGCLDKSHPVKDSAVAIHHQMYFAMHIEGWQNRGVAFIKKEEDRTVLTWGRMYLITREQFLQVLMQENGYDPSCGSLHVDLDAVCENGSVQVPELLYGHIICIGSKDSYPVVTFTAGWDDSSVRYEPPGENYLRVIAEGIRETYHISYEEIARYLAGLPGIQGNIGQESLERVIAGEVRGD